MDIKIAYLKDYQEYITAVAHWSFLLSEKQNQPTTIKAEIEKFKTHCHDDKLPITLIALDNDRLVGMCSLRETEDLKTELTPWLTRLYTTPDYDNSPACDLLIDEIKQIAKQMGYDTLYQLIYDFSSKDCCFNQGWSLKSKEQLNQQSVFILEVTLRASD
jgi:Acetyltransferase (GNAT) family